MQIQNVRKVEFSKEKPKFKVQNYSSKLKIFILISLLTFNIKLLTPPVKAADSSPSADIQTKLEELKKEIASKAAKIKQEIEGKLRDKAYVGRVKSSSDNSITLAANSGPKMVSLNEDTIFENKQKSTKGKAKFSAKTIREDDYVAALGDSDETGVLLAKKVILLPTPSERPKTYLWGQIVSMSDELTTLKDRDFKNVAVAFIKAVQAKINDFVILTGAKDKNDIFSAGFVYVIPQGGILRPKKNASSSASVATSSAKEATKSASPKPKSTSR